MVSDMPPGPKPRHPAIQHVLNFFEFKHLPPKLQEVSNPFCALAHEVADRNPSSPETTVALRKLLAKPRQYSVLEAKDATVRAAL